MLSVNKLLIFLFIGIFSSSLYAVDVSKFDIKNLKLGMNKSEILRNIPCSSPKIIVNYIDYKRNKIPYETMINCKLYTYSVTLDRYNKAIEIHRKINFNNEPSWGKIESKFLNKYGSADNTKRPGNCNVVELYWGKENGYELQTYFNKCNGYVVNITLKDHAKLMNNVHYQRKESKIFHNKLKEEASNIDL